MQGLDRYAYVNNSPIMYTDPSGHEICLDDGYCGSLNSKSYWNKIIKDIETSYEISFEGNWSFDNKMAVVTGVILAGSRIARDIGTGSGSEAFKKAFIPTKFKWVDGACGGEDDRCYADAYSFPNTITFYSSHWTRQLNEKGLEIGKPFKKGNPAVSFALVIHEIGHAFNTETGGVFNDATAAEGITNKEGFGIIKGASGQTEVTADLFANYILGTLGPRSDGINLPEFMQTNIATWVDLASNYVWSGNR